MRYVGGEDREPRRIGGRTRGGVWEVGDERVRVLKGWETGEIGGIMHNG